MALFQQAGRLVEDAEDLFKNLAWLQVLIGQNVEPVPTCVDQLKSHPTPGNPPDILGQSKNVFLL